MLEGLLLLFLTFNCVTVLTSSGVVGKSALEKHSGPKEWFRIGSIRSNADLEYS